MDLLNAEIEAGNTYPQDSKLDKEQFINYYFGYFVAILVQGEFTPENTDLSTLNFSKLFLGSFYVKPNYPGRSSHICNGGFLVSVDARGKGVGTVMGENYIKIAPKLGFKSSIFNLVFVSNVASYKIWDRLGFKRVGTIPKAGYLKGLGYTDAYVYGYEFESEDSLEGQNVE
jgi:RimJ/RimL family protein N-acetyltransferase